MTAYVQGYDGRGRLCMVACTAEAKQACLEKGSHIMEIGMDTITFWPEQFQIPRSGISEEKLAMLGDYDIVEIGPTGVLYRAYSDREADTTVFLGGGCNSNCIMCPASDLERKKAFSYTEEQVLRFIDYLPDRLEYLVITGGEPTLKPQLFLRALERIQGKFLHTNVLLLTNGRSLSNQQFCTETLKRIPQNFRVAIPVHAAEESLHDRITRVPGSHKQTLRAVELLLAAGVDVEIRIVVNQVNAPHLFDIARLIVNRFSKVTCVNFVALEPRGNCAKDLDHVFINYDDSFMSARQSIDYLVGHGIDVGLYNYPLCYIDRNYWGIAARSISKYKNRFMPDCKDCSVSSICPGFFTVATKLLKPSVFPM